RRSRSLIVKSDLISGSLQFAIVGISFDGKHYSTTMEDVRVSGDRKVFQIFARLLDGKTATLGFTAPQAYTHEIKRRIFDITRIPVQLQRIVSGGRLLDDESFVSTPECNVHLLLSLRGGKGGFGSLLRGAATKAGQKKTNNFDACRDMSGRRLRHVNAEKRLEEWKEGEEERKLERIAQDFLKKKAKKGVKGAGDGEAAKYVAKYREESAKCVAEVEDAVREAFSSRSAKRKGKFPMNPVEAKKKKIWLGKKKLDESDGEEDTEDDSYSDNDDDKETEKSVILNDGSNSASISDATGASSEGEVKEGSAELTCEPSAGRDAINDDIHEVAEHQASGIEKITETQEISSSENDEVTTAKSPTATDITNVEEEKAAEVVTNVEEEKPAEVVNDDSDMKKPLNFEEFNSPSDLEVLGLEKLKWELQERGLKCGGTIKERAARLFLLKTTPLDKLPKKLLAKK
ncbi:Replication stress response regulator SDE2, partial [Linum perenne]